MDVSIDSFALNVGELSRFPVRLRCLCGSGAATYCMMRSEIDSGEAVVLIGGFEWLIYCARPLVGRAGNARRGHERNASRGRGFRLA
ncbi:MAG: hypothetical protein ABW186_15725 [Rhodanobacteraceae bacterium]